jgi:ribose transport system ATP-binding protein
MSCSTCCQGSPSRLAAPYRVNGKAKTFSHPSDAIAAGLTFVPGNRAEALLSERSVRENIALPFAARMRVMGPFETAP